MSTEVRFACFSVRVWCGDAVISVIRIVNKGGLLRQFTGTPNTILYLRQYQILINCQR